MSRIILLVFVTIVVFSLISSCDNSTGPVHNEPLTFEENLALSPRADVEAEQMALYLSGDMVAPQELYLRIKRGLKKLRQQYANSIPAIDYRFLPAMIAGRLSITFSDESADKIRAGTFFDLDSLNAFFNGTLDTNTYLWAWQGANIGSFHFQARLNPVRLYDEYAKIENIGHIQPVSYGGDSPNIFPWLDDAGYLVFILRNAWGDCPVGCMASYFYYFRETFDGFDIIWEGYKEDVDTSEFGQKAYEIYQYFENYGHSVFWGSTI